MSRSRSPSTSAISALIGPRQLLQQVALEAPAAGVLEPARLALVVAEERHREVEVAVAVEIAGPHVGDARRACRATTCGVKRCRPSFSSRTTAPIRALFGNSTPRLATARSRSPSPSRSTACTCAGPAHVGNRALGEAAGGRLAQPRDAVRGGVGGDDVGKAVAIEVGDGDVGNHRPMGWAATGSPTGRARRKSRRGPARHGRRR